MKRKHLEGQHQEIKKKLIDLYTEIFLHEGYGSLQVEMRFLKRGQKEVILICGKEFRYVVDFPEDQECEETRPGMSGETGGARGSTPASNCNRLGKPVEKSERR